MLNGKELGQAIGKAIELKMATGSITSKSDVARHFKIKTPSIYDWIKKGSISKEKLPELWNYFSDVVGPEHWGLRFIPSTSHQNHSAREKTAFDSIICVIASAIIEHAGSLIKDPAIISDTARKAAEKLTTEGLVGEAVSERIICAGEEECDLLETFRKTNESGRKNILVTARALQEGNPIAGNVETFPVKKILKYAQN